MGGSSSCLPFGSYIPFCPLPYLLYRILSTASDIFSAIVAKRKVYTKTTTARAKAAVSKFRAAKKKASTKLSRKAKRAETQS